MLYQLSILLNDLIHLRNRLVNLANTVALLFRSGGNLIHDVANALYRRDEILHGLARLIHAMCASVYFTERRINQRTNLFGSIGTAAGKAANFLCYHGKALAMLARTRRLYRSVKR